MMGTLEEECAVGRPLALGDREAVLVPAAGDAAAIPVVVEGAKLFVDVDDDMEDAMEEDDAEDVVEDGDEDVSG